VKGERRKVEGGRWKEKGEIRNVKGKGERWKEKGEIRNVKGERRKEKGERRKEKGERRKEKGERRKEKGERGKGKGESWKKKGEIRNVKGERRKENGERRKEKGEGRKRRRKEKGERRKSKEKDGRIKDKGKGRKRKEKGERRKEKGGTKGEIGRSRAAATKNTKRGTRVERGGHDALVRRANVETVAVAVHHRSVVALGVRLHPEAVLVVKLERLVRPRDLLVGVQQAPHVVARRLPAGVVPDVTGGVLLVDEGG
jgi:hypothetical protein